MYDHNEKAGNQGDVIKHVALLAAANAIMKPLNGTFHYADTFAGYAYNPIRSAGEWQNGIGALNKPSKKILNADICFWQSLWRCDVGLPGSVYPGSSTFIRKLCLKNSFKFKASLWDISPAVVSQLMQAYDPNDVEIFSRSARVNDLAAMEPDLLLIDPPDLEVVEHLLKFFEVVPNLILWLPILSDGDRETKLSKHAHTICQKRDYNILSVLWAGSGKMTGCRLVCQLEEEAFASLKAAVRDTVNIMGWEL